MKYLLLIVSVFCLGLYVPAQPKEHITWKYEAKKKADGVYKVTITATLEKGWHIYSQNTGKGGPVPTKITFKTNPLLTLDGVVLEQGKLEKVYDKSFKTEVSFFANKVQFVQVVKIKGNIKTNINTTVEYMICNDEECLPPAKKVFDIKLS